MRYKRVALVEGTDIVRRELGRPEARLRAADPKLWFARQEPQCRPAQDGAVLAEVVAFSPEGRCCAISSPVASQTSPRPRAGAMKSRKMQSRIGRPVTWGC